MKTSNKTTKKSPKRPSKSKVLVTGASGFLGRHLVELLCGQSESVVALVRRPSLQLEKLGVETVLGDIANSDDCQRALARVKTVFHLAGLVSRHPEDASARYRIHVDGTRTLLQQAARAGVERIVVSSTSGTIGVSENPDEISNEQSPYRLNTVSRWPYYLSKIYQEQAALDISTREKLDVVLVNPSLLLGPGDERGSSTTDVENVIRGRVPLIPSGGGVAFVDARDAAAGCLLAMDKGATRERYILSAANMPLETFLAKIARLAKKAAPRPWIGADLLHSTAKLLDGLANHFGRRPPIDVQSVEMAQYYWYVDNTKAKEDLGFSIREPQQTLVDTVRDLQKRHNLTNSLSNQESFYG